MHRTFLRRSPLALLAACCAFAGQLAAQKQDAPAPLNQATTEALCDRYGQADHWVQKAVILLSLNTSWHPAGSTMIVQALADKDPRLNAFGIEALLRADPETLPAVASPALLDELIVKQLARSNAHLKERALLALKRLVPTVEAADKAAWSRWWSTAKETFAPAEWKPREQAAAGEGGTVAAAQRAFDLYQAGLDLMICIDSTGSMQPTIDALAHALGEMVDILDGISPKMRLGIVHYKDYGELGAQGAKVVQPFSKNIRTARKSLEELRAHGGEDLPEAVFGGLELALDPKMNWQKDANKLVVLIGDAPPHDRDKDKVLKLVRAAHETPGVPFDKPVTGGAKPDEAPFLTSCIGVFLELQGKLREQEGYREFVDSQKKMRGDFTEIAKAGGGVFVEVEFTFTDQPPPESKDKPKGKDKERDKGGSIASAATRRIVEHILVLSFGERFAREMRDFVRIFFEYREADLIK